MNHKLCKIISKVRWIKSNLCSIHHNVLWMHLPYNKITCWNMTRWCKFFRFCFKCSRYVWDETAFPDVWVQLYCISLRAEITDLHLENLHKWVKFSAQEPLSNFFSSFDIDCKVDGIKKNKIKYRSTSVYIFFSSFAEIHWNRKTTICQLHCWSCC